MDHLMRQQSKPIAFVEVTSLNVCPFFSKPPGLLLCVRVFFVNNTSSFSLRDAALPPLVSLRCIPIDYFDRVVVNHLQVLISSTQWELADSMQEVVAFNVLGSASLLH